MVLVWILTGFAVYWAAVIFLDKSGFLEKYNVDTAGPLFLIRTYRGKKLLDRLARPKRFWRIYGNIGVALSIIVMFLVFLLLLLVGYTSLTNPPEPQALNEPKNLLAIPGINDFLPLSMAPEIIIGLAVGIIVHEGGHGLMCRVGDIGVSNMGLVNLAVLPIGAFVEPDEEEVKDSDAASRTRMFAAGVMNNFVLTIVVFFLLAVSMMAVVPVDGVGVQGVTPNSSADDAGMVQGDVVLAVEGQNVTTPREYTDVVENHSMGEPLEIKVKTSDGVENRTLSLGDQRGAVVSQVVKGSVAEEAGIQKNDFIVSVGGENVSNPKEYRSELENISKGEEFVIEFKRPEGEEVRNATVTLTESRGPPLGVYTYSVRELVGISPYHIKGVHSFLSSFHPRSWLALIFLPFAQAQPTFPYPFAGFTGFLTNFYELNGIASVFGGYYWLIPNVLFWTGWINFNLAFFNCTPAIPLDGGQILREGFRKGISPFLSGDELENAADILTGAVAVLMFGSIVLMFAAPRLL